MGLQFFVIPLLFNDVTESYINQRKIESLQNNISLALEAGELAIWVYDPVCEELISLESGTLNQVKMTKEEYSSLIYPEDLDILWGAVDRLLSGESNKGDVKFRVLINQELRWYQCFLMSTYVEGDRVKITGIKKDITEEVRAKEIIDQKHLQIQYSEELLSLIFNKLPIQCLIRRIRMLFGVMFIALRWKSH